MSEVPEVDLLPEHKKDSILGAQKLLKPYLQFFHDQKILFNSIDK
jgi:hypothetical protein